MGLVFDSNPEKGLNLEMRGFVDASYADNYGTPKDNRRSTTGFVFMLGGAAISWSSKRQAVVACSTTESEYIAAYTATREAICLRRMLIELGETSVDTVKGEVQLEAPPAPSPRYVVPAVPAGVLGWRSECWPTPRREQAQK